MGSTPDFRYPVSASSMIDSHSEQYSSSLVLRRPQKGRAAALRDEPSKVRLLKFQFGLSAVLESSLFYSENFDTAAFTSTSCRY